MRPSRAVSTSSGQPPPGQTSRWSQAIAQQPLWGIGGWVAVLDDQDTARAHADATFPAIGRALHLTANIPAWHAGLS